jgi:uncharacterized protein YjbI with pentapeptide repeats
MIRRNPTARNCGPHLSELSPRRGWLIRIVTVVAMTLATAGVAAVTGVPGAAPAFADTVVAGCTIVANPTSSHFTNCPDVDFSTTSLSGVDLSYANLSGSVFARCTMSSQFPFLTCQGTDLQGADLHDADASSATFNAKTLGGPSLYVSATADLTGATLTGLDASRADMEQVFLPGEDLSGANFSDADLSMANQGSGPGTGSDLSGATLAGTNFSGVNLSGSDLSNTTWTSADLASATLTDAVLDGASFTGADLSSAELSGTALVPPDQTAMVPSSSGGTVTWPTPAALPGATPGACAPPSGSTFPFAVTDDQGHQAHGTFTLFVEEQATTSPLAITTTSLPSATIGHQYSATLSATGGNPPDTWKLVANDGKLPPGLRLDHATGVVSGTPTKKSVTSTFTVEVRDTKTVRTKGHPSTRGAATATFTITVSP